MPRPSIAAWNAASASAQLAQQPGMLALQHVGGDLVAMGVEAAQLRHEDLAVALHRGVGRDQLRHQVQLLGQAGFDLAVGGQRREGAVDHVGAVGRRRAGDHAGKARRHLERAALLRREGRAQVGFLLRRIHQRLHRRLALRQHRPVADVLVLQRVGAEGIARTRQHQRRAERAHAEAAVATDRDHRVGGGQHLGRGAAPADTGGGVGARAFPQQLLVGMREQVVGDEVGAVGCGQELVLGERREQRPDVEHRRQRTGRPGRLQRRHRRVQAVVGAGQRHQARARQRQPAAYRGITTMARGIGGHHGVQPVVAAVEEDADQRLVVGRPCTARAEQAAERGRAEGGRRRGGTGQAEEATPAQAGLGRQGGGHGAWPHRCHRTIWYCGEVKTR